jgi:outer membrane protein OmpA-like peptidoglycan-associated protein
MLADMPIVQVRLLGHADRVGSADRNRVLAAARARTVADFLVASGVAAEIIEADGMGEDDLPVATADGVAEPLNRSVAILAVPRPTS